jgi:hypothetical protein
MPGQVEGAVMNGIEGPCWMMLGDQYNKNERKKKNVMRTGFYRMQGMGSVVVAGRIKAVRPTTHMRYGRRRWYES